MAGNEFETLSNAPSTLTAVEARELLEWVARNDLESLPRVEDVAETLHLEVSEVEELLAKVRNNPRPAVTPPRKESKNWAAMTGWAVAAMAVAFALVHRPTAPVVKAPAIPMPAPIFPGMPTQTPVKDVVVLPLEVTPPNGFSVGIQANGVRITVAGREDIRPTSIADAKKRLVACVAVLLQRAESIAFNDAMGSGAVGLSRLKPQIDVSLTGPGDTNTTFSVPTELHNGLQSIRTYRWRDGELAADVEQLFEGPNKSGARTAAGAGSVLPPSGFGLNFWGRRLTMAMSGPLVIEPMDEAETKERLFQAMRTTLDADLKPMEGHWRQDAEREARLQVPDMSRFSISSRDVDLDFFVPTKKGTPREVQDKILREKANEAIQDWKRAAKGAG